MQVSAIYEDTSLEANLRLVVSRLIFYEDRKQGQVFDFGSINCALELILWFRSVKEIRNAL